ncbi:14784_t:CDS:2 [Entrophospora sp. SA101]|nr:14784_t:CDS:2 [Entrophospora sp. SA101]
MLYVNLECQDATHPSARGGDRNVPHTQCRDDENSHPPLLD